MQRDFHFHGVGVLARAAGFPPAEALTIAYASQYVDDATESELVKIKVAGKDMRFDPVRTAYKGLDMLDALEWSAQKRVYLPFHFLPARPFTSAAAQEFSFLTEKASPFADMVLQRAFADELPGRRLCAIGIALHTYADTWSHQGFSGRQDRTENDVENIRIVNEAGKEEHPTMENALLDALPQIGHAEAGYHPDLAHETWIYDSRRQKNLRRDNGAEFLDAARRIHEKLLKFGQLRVYEPWARLRDRFERLFRTPPERKPELAARIVPSAYDRYHAGELDKRCERWRQEFQSWFPDSPFRYSRTAWRDEAVKGDTKWDGWSSRDWERMAPVQSRAGFWDSNWVQFHRAALRQRHLVLENLP